MNLIHEKLKQVVPQDKQLQMSHFVRLVELINEVSKSQLQQNELTTLLQVCIQFQFPLHTQQMIANSLSLLVIKQPIETMHKIIENLIQYINKKGSLKSIALNWLVILIQFTQHDLKQLPFTLTQEVSILFMKLLKGSDYKTQLCNILFFLVDIQKQEVVKYCLKFAQNEKNIQQHQSGINALIQLMKKEIICEQLYILAFKTDNTQQFIKFFSAFLPLQQQILALMKKDKLKQQVQLQPREYAQKIFQLFDENLSKFPTNLAGSIFISYKKYLTQEYQKLGLPVIRGAFEISCSYLSQITDDIYIHNIYKKCNDLCLYMIKQIPLQQRQELLEYFFDKFQRSQLQKWNVYVYKLLLKGLTFLFDSLGSLVFNEKRNKPSEFIDILTPLFKINEIFQQVQIIDKPIYIGVSRNIFGLFKSFFQENKKWQQCILSAILNYAKITLAELSVNENIAGINTLRLQCALLGYLFSLLDLQLHSVSSELINHLWDSAKSFLTKSLQFRRIGWIVVAELLMVPYFSSANKIKEIGELIEQSLNDEIKDEQQLLNFTSVCLPMIAIATCTTKTIKDTTKKFLAQQAMRLFQKLQQCTFDKQSPFVMSSKYIFYQLIRQLTPKHYSNELNQLVQYCLDDIINCNSKWECVDILKNNHYVDDLLGIVRSEFQLVTAASKFLGHIMISSTFTLKNKINFIRYINGTLQTQLNVKDNQIKTSKQQCYLYCIYQIAHKLHQTNTIISTEFNEQIFQMINMCQVEPICSQLCAYLYCTMLQIKDVDQTDQLNQLLSQQTQANHSLLVQEIVNKKISGIQLQIQNLFMKVLSHMTQDACAIIQLFQNMEPMVIKWMFLVFAISQDEKPIETQYFKQLTQIILNYVRNGGIQDIYFHIIYQECRLRLQNKSFQLLKLDFALNLDSEQTVQQTIELLIKKPKLEIAIFLDLLTEKYSIINYLNQILQVLNQLFTNQRVQSTIKEVELRNLMKNLFIKSYNMPLSELLDSLYPYILDEFIVGTKLQIHIKLRIFLLKRLSKLFKQCDTSTQIFDFLFKVITSNYEEVKEISFEMFNHFFCKENDLLNFAAQIDSILCDTIRRENQNPPSVNITNMKLISKFAKIVKDEILGDKMIQLLSKPFQSETRKKLIPSQFYSEKSQFNLLIQRISSLGSIYLKKPKYFSNLLIEQLKAYTEDVLEDLFIILCAPRSFIREYQNYKLLYNGKKYSYDAQFLHQQLPKLLRISALNSNIHFSLVGYLITQYGAFEQNEQTFKKYVDNLTKEKINQTKQYRIKGIELLAMIINKNPENYSLITGIQPLLGQIAAEISYAPSLCLHFYQAFCQHPIDCSQILEPLKEIYLQVDNNQKLTCLSVLLKLNGYQDQVLSLYWDFLLNQDYDFMRCSQLIHYYKEKIIGGEGCIQTVLEILDTKEMRVQDYYLLLNMNLIINNNSDYKKYQKIIECNKSLIGQNTLQVLQILPLLSQMLRKDCYLIIIKYILLTYLLAQEKIQLFENLIKIILSMFYSTQDQNILQVIKQAIKVMIQNTQITQDQILDQQIKNQVIQIQEEIKRELQEKQLKEQQQVQQQQQGVIKLKMFG